MKKSKPKAFEVQRQINQMTAIIQTVSVIAKNIEEAEKKAMVENGNFEILQEQVLDERHFDNTIEIIESKQT